MIFNKNTATLLIELSINRKTLEWLRAKAEQEGLVEKSEFHITVVGRETGEIIIHKLDILTPEERAKKIDEIARLASDFAWHFSLQTKHYFISKKYPGTTSQNAEEERKSYIQLVDLPDLNEFYKKLNLLLGLDLEIPVPHITLFTTSTLADKKSRGIGIYSKQQFKSLQPQEIFP